MELTEKIYDRYKTIRRQEHEIGYTDIQLLPSLVELM